jgi:hypothetical protein
MDVDISLDESIFEMSFQLQGTAPVRRGRNFDLDHERLSLFHAVPFSSEDSIHASDNLPN